MQSAKVKIAFPYGFVKAISCLSFCIFPWPRPLAQTWHARVGFYGFGSPSIATTALYSRQLAPGQAGMSRCGDGKWGIHKQWRQVHIHIPSHQGRLAYMDVVNCTAFLKYYCDISLILASRARAGNLHSAFCIGCLQKPWPRPDLQWLSSIDYTPEVLQWLHSVPVKSRQGGLDINVKILSYEDV